LVLYRPAKIVVRVQGKKGLDMKRVAYSLVLAVGLASSSVMAADMAVKAPPAAAPPPSPWDVAITAALMTDYNFRGVTQSNHRASTQAGFELRYTWNPTWQSYAGISGESLDFPNRAAAEIDLYAGIRPTIDKLALDFGIWEYYYPDGQCFNTVALCNAFGGGPSVAATLPNGNTVVQDESFYEVYAKGTYTISDQWSAGLQEWYSPSVVNTGAWGWYTTGNLTFTAPSTWFKDGVGMYVSGDLAYWALGTSNAFYGTGIVGNPFFSGVKYTSYWNWDAGLGFTYKAFTLDLRYYDTNLTKAECNVFTSDQTATFAASNVTLQNPGGLGSNWCSAAFIAKLSFATNLSSIK
jgi:uncharacterized protein (TIGR02001 family)